MVVNVMFLLYPNKNVNIFSKLGNNYDRQTTENFMFINVLGKIVSKLNIREGSKRIRFTQPRTREFIENPN